MKTHISKLIIVIMMLCTITVYAQNDCRVQGVVVDATGETLPYATVGAYKGKKSVAVLAANTDGAFTITLKQGQTYEMEVSSVGYKSHRQTVEVPAAANLDMGNIVLQSSTELDEVVVVSQKPIIKSDAEKIIYDVSADPESDGKTLLDMMRKVPMVTVDAEDNVQLNGSGNFKVLINGKESAMVKNNLKEVLKAMPAASVQDIQVITNPSTRYDAEGVGGVINIITAHAGGNKSDDVAGVTGSLTAYGDVLQGSYGGNVFLTGQYKKFTASLNYSGGSFASNQYTDANSYNYNNPDMYHTLVSTSAFGDMKVDGQYHFLSFESSYELDLLNLFTLGASANLGNYVANGLALNRTHAQDGRLMVNYIDNIMQGGMWGGVSANFDYQHTFDRPQHTLTASYRYEYNPQGSAYSDSIIFDSETLNAPMEGQKNENNAYAHEHTVQLDYNNPINEMHSVEAGAKYIARLNHSDDDYLALLSGMWHSAGQGRTFDYTQQVASLYAGYAFTRTTWGLRVGGRYEHTFINATNLQAGTRVDYGKPYGNFVPYLSLNYNISPMESLRFSYTQRINRPGINYLSPYEKWTTPYSVEVGNPDLLPEVSHSFSAGYSIFKGVFNLNFECFARISNNAISNVVRVEPESGVIRTTHDNIANESVYGFSAYISGQPSPKFNYYINFQPAFKTFSAPNMNIADERFGGQLFAGCNWMAWKGGTVSVNGGGGLPDGDMQMESELMWYYYGLSVSQRFFDDKLKLTLSANNMFNKYNYYRIHSYGDGFENITNGGHRSQRLQLSVTYSFGELKSQVKKANRSIINDDIVGGSSEGMGTAGGGM
ncbi:MAG: TonB-dependent receptor [Bacteroidaceae bacterium]|nr:TonB-dependent receptor [Bacteroidaceae bacterium]